MCRRRVVPAHQRGRWRGRVPRPVYIYPSCGLNSKADRVILNLPFAVSKYDPKPKLEKDEGSTSLLLPKKGRSRKGRLTRLPMEILLQITGYLVPTDTSLHIFPSTREQWNATPRTTVVHKFAEVAPNEQDRVRPGSHTRARPHLTALARTCRVLSEAYYETMYGNNHFIVELASNDVYPTIEGPATPAVEIWTKALRGRRQGMWPLTQRSIPYVKHLILLGTLHFEGSELAKATLRSHLASAVELLGQAQHLKNLVVDIRYSPQPCNPKLPPRIPQAPPVPDALPGPPPPPDLGSNLRLGWGVQGPQDTVLRLRNVFTHAGYAGLEEFWKPFEDLRGFQDVVISGHISPEMAEGLRAKMMSELERLNLTDDMQEPSMRYQAAGLLVGAGHQAAKPQKNNSKRKRGTESSKSLKSRRRA